MPGACVTAPVPGGLRTLSLREEDGVRPALAFTARGWAALQAHVGRLVRAYCEGREAIQAANGGPVEPAEICADISHGDAEPQGPRSPDRAPQRAAEAQP